MEAAPESQLPGPSRMIAKTRVVLRVALPVAPALAAGALLRLWMLKEFFGVAGDSLIYGDLARNLVLHGKYAFSDRNGVLHSTLIRLPGYPLFLAACFRLFGMENYGSAVYVQIALELLGCLLLAGFVRRIAPPEMKNGASQATLWLAVLCPFTASYAIAPLTESLTLFAIALALWAVGRFHEQPRWSSALWFTFAVVFAAMLRPDGVLVGVALSPALLIGMRHGTVSQARLAKMAAVCVLLAMVPFAAWTARNWRVFHVFEPLAPRYANDPGQTVYPGFQRWVKTWCLDFTCTNDVYWPVPGSPLDLTKLPSRAFDSPAQYAETAALVADYNNIDNGFDIVPEQDARFAWLADERIAAHPLRYYLWLPLGRVADMWLRPRVENLPIDLDWWVYEHHNDETLFSWGYAGLSALYLLLALAGLCLRPKFWLWMLAFIVLRSAMLLIIEAPETRYTLECFPMLCVLGGIAVGWGLRKILPFRRLPQDIHRQWSPRAATKFRQT
jgi:hypothetical protein